MPKPLRSEDPNPRNVQFSHFGVLNDGSRSKGAFFTSLFTNAVVLFLLVVLGSVVHTTIVEKKKTDLTFVEVKPPEVKPPPPPPPVKLPPVPHIEPPKVVIEKPIPPPPDVKPIEVPQPKPFVPSPAPKRVTPPPAPVAVHMPVVAASVPNHDAHPSAVKLGNPDNPLKSLTGPAVAPVNFGQAGHPGMSPANTGNGPQATKVVMGNGCPNCQNLNGHQPGVARVEGIPNGRQGGTGTAPYRPGVQTVQIPTQQAQVQPTHLPSASGPASSAPVVTYKPQPVYSAEAKAMHLEGNVSVRIRVTPSGSVEVLGVVHGLGHGLDESAESACRGTRFKPALDASGHPVQWEGVVLVRFQMS
ncbi:MAG: energy transducer TonB [Acidobacteriota bacterium]